MTSYACRLAYRWVALCEKGHLTLYHTIPTFNDPGVKAFCKYYGKRRKMLVTSSFSFSHDVLYPSRGRIQFSITYTSTLLSVSPSNLDLSKIMMFGKRLMHSQNVGWLVGWLHWGFSATLTAKIISWRSVKHMCFLAFSYRY